MVSAAVIDYGLGNVNSVRNMLKKVGVSAVVTRDPGQLADAGTLILPGVGSFGAGMEMLEASGLIPVLHEAVERGQRLVGICLGMQLLGTSSQESDRPGLGLIPAHFCRFDFSVLPRALPVPHMGWNEVQLASPEGWLNALPQPSRFYFVHSFHATDVPAEHVLLTAEYGLRFPAAYSKGQVMGFQFHPEKSHRFGMALFRALFAESLESGQPPAESSGAA